MPFSCPDATPFIKKDPLVPKGKPGGFRRKEYVILSFIKIMMNYEFSIQGLPEAILQFLPVHFKIEKLSFF
jgi:hypothetical protein